MGVIDDKIMDVLRYKTTTEKIAILERIGKQLRQKNSIRINRGYSTGKFDAERPDLIDLKDGTN